MAYHIVGLDIGSRNVRAVLLERSFRGYEVVEARQAPITQGEEGGTPSQAAVAEAEGTDATEPIYRVETRTPDTTPTGINPND